jgi:hypothetical protein
MAGIVARALGSGILKHGALGFAAKAQSYSDGARSRGVQFSRAARNLEERSISKCQHPVRQYESLELPLTSRELPASVPWMPARVPICTKRQ